MLNEEVRQVMRTDPVTVSADDGLMKAHQLMMLTRCYQLPVVENGHLTGMITFADLSERLGKRGAKVCDVMKETVIRIAPKDKLGTAAELFMDGRFDILPVVNLRNELKGVILESDIVRCALKEEYTTTVLYGDVIEGHA